MNLDEYDFYGDNSRWFLARVINNQDPAVPPLGRIQIRIYGVHSETQEDIPESKLPWAQTLLPVTEGGTSGIGRIPQVQPNALVFGIFLDGKSSQLPLVLGSLNQIEIPSVRQQETTSQNTRLYGGTQLDSIISTPSQSQRPSQYSDQYNFSDYVFSNNGVIVSESVRSLQRDASIDAKRFTAMRFFVENGYDRVQAAGIVGNLEAESNFNTTVVSQFTGEYSQGIAQWNPAYGRLQKLFEYANQLRLDWRDYHVQLQFIIQELRGNVPNPAPHNIETRIRRCTSYSGQPLETNSTWLICRYYENPADPLGKLPARQRFADIAYRQFTQGLTS